MTCFLTVLYVACATAQSLPGAPAPACDSEPVAVLARVRGSLLDQEEPPWLYEVQPERRETTCGEHEIELVAIETRYPTCVVGHVERTDTTIGEGEEAITLPARPPYLGVCCTPGCRLAGPGEHIPYGTPIGYPEARAERYRLNPMEEDARGGH